MATSPDPIGLAQGQSRFGQLPGLRDGIEHGVMGIPASNTCRCQRSLRARHSFTELKWPVVAAAGHSISRIAGVRTP